MSGASPEMKPTAVLVVELAPTGDPDADPRVAVAVLRPLIAQHDGVMVDLPGRRVAVQFSSAFAAVNCAVALQRSAIGEGGGLRIGIDFGDTLSNGETIVGDGVYTAARLQDMAEFGNVCVTGAIYDRVTGRVGVDFEALGAQSLSDRSTAVRVYRVEPEVDESKQEVEVGGAAVDPEQFRMPTAPEFVSAGTPKNVDAERQAQKGFWLYHRNDSESTVEAQREFWGALDADPNYAAAAAGIALCLLQERQRGWSTDPGRALIKADAGARRPVALKPKYAL